MGHIRAVERVDEGTFPQPHVMQVVAQDGTGQLRTTYIQCKVWTSPSQHHWDPNTPGCPPPSTPAPSSRCVGAMGAAPVPSPAVLGTLGYRILVVLGSLLGSVGYAAISAVGFTGLSVLVILGSLGHPVISVVGSLRYQPYIH